MSLQYQFDTPDEMFHKEVSEILKSCPKMLEMLDRIEHLESLFEEVPRNIFPADRTNISQRYELNRLSKYCMGLTEYRQAPMIVKACLDLLKGRNNFELDFHKAWLAGQISEHLSLLVHCLGHWETLERRVAFA